ncbi:MAG: CPBP family intramembrane metalloprotease [Ignavibacteria bacterium]|nr:MAG: CPBP family intramembrane metalloprotease [Ignavibacteria bacterium]
MQRQNFFGKLSPVQSLNPVISPGVVAFMALVGVFILYQVGGSVITLIIFGFDLEKANVQALRIMTMAGQVLFILLPALLLAKYAYEDVTTVIRASIPELKDVALFSIGLIILIPLFQSYLYLQNYLIESLASQSEFINSIKTMLDQLDKLVESAYGDLLRVDNIFEGILVILVIALTPAICEEVLFRGVIQTSFMLRTRPYMAAFYTALFFGLYHFNPYGLIPLVILGFYLSYSVIITDSIGVSMILHFLNNFVSIILFFIFGDEEMLQTGATDNTNISQHLLEFIILGLIFTIFITFIHRYYKKRLEAKNDLPQV